MPRWHEISVRHEIESVFRVNTLTGSCSVLLVVTTGFHKRGFIAKRHRVGANGNGCIVHGRGSKHGSGGARPERGWAHSTSNFHEWGCSARTGMVSCVRVKTFQVYPSIVSAYRTSCPEDMVLGHAVFRTACQARIRVAKLAGQPAKFTMQPARYMCCIASCVIL